MGKMVEEEDLYKQLFKRIDKIRESKNMSRRQLCFLLNVSGAFFTKPREISHDIIIRLKKVFPEFSYSWILEGKEEEVKSDGNINVADRFLINSLLEINELQSKQIKSLIAGKDLPKEDCDENLYKMIDILRDELKASSNNGETIAKMIEIIKSQNEQLKELGQNKGNTDENH